MAGEPAFDCERQKARSNPNKLRRKATLIERAELKIWTVFKRANHPRAVFQANPSRLVLPSVAVEMTC